MTDLHLVSLAVEPAGLMRFAANQGLLNYHDDAQGYAIHAWMAAMFGNLGCNCSDSCWLQRITECDHMNQATLDGDS